MRQLELQLQMSALFQDSEWSDQKSTGQTEDFSLNTSREVLTPRRRQVLGRYLGGETREEIAEHLGLSPNTVRNHIRLIYEELGLTNRVDALRWALEQPSMAHQLLRQHENSDLLDSPSHRRRTSEKSTTIEQMIDEAIAFFQQEVVETPLESA